jgi:hypothetical protein
MNRDEFIQRITTALLAGKRKSGGLADPSTAAAYATNVAPIQGAWHLLRTSTVS